MKEVPTEPAVFSPTKTAVLKTISKGLSATGTALCCMGQPALGCAAHTSGELLESVVDGVQSNLEANSELATNTAIMKMLEGYDDRIRILEDKIDDQPAKKKNRWDPYEKISCHECDGEFSASNLSKHPAG